MYRARATPLSLRQASNPQDSHFLTRSTMTLFSPSFICILVHIAPVTVVDKWRTLQHLRGCPESSANGYIRRRCRQRRYWCGEQLAFQTCQGSGEGYVHMLPLEPFGHSKYTLCSMLADLFTGQLSRQYNFIFSFMPTFFFLVCFTLSHMTLLSHGSHV